MPRIKSLLAAAIASLLFLPLAALAGTAERADSAYSADDFALAADLYNQALAEKGEPDPGLLYNLGNAHWRLGQPGRAILNYERALRLAPAMKEARQNLEFANTRITDRPGERGTFVGNALDAAALRASSDAWAWAAFGTFVLVLAGLALYAWAPGVGLRKTGFFGAGALVIATFVFLFLSFRGAALASSTAEAVIVKPSTILSTAPRLPVNRSQEAMLLHEGTKVRILDSVRSATDSLMWLDVEVDNTHRAWLDARDAERIKNQ